MIKSFYVDCDGDVFHMKNGKITGINGFDYGDEWEEEAIDCEEAWQQYLDSICGVDHGCSDDSDCCHREKAFQSRSSLTLHEFLSNKQ